MSKKLNAIAVDLTPILPGGDNGGAKIFVIELLYHLARIAPQVRFILLTRNVSHDELAILDYPNMRREMVTDLPEIISPPSRLLIYSSKLVSKLPGRLHWIANRIVNKIFRPVEKARFGSLLRDMDADLLFCPFTAPIYYDPGITTVSVIYDLQFRTYPEFFSEDDLLQRQNSFTEACQKADALSAISNHSRNDAIAHGNLDPNRIRTIYIRMNQSFLSDTKDEHALLSRSGLMKKRYLLYPANFWKHKNHEMLLTAFNLACHQGLAKDIKLVCTGEPGERQKWLMNASLAMGLENRVIFPGFIPNTELSIFLNNCCGLIFPSLFEGFGIPVIEAMSAGVPVACSNVTSLPEVAGDAALFFDPRVPNQVAKAMISIVEDKPLREQLINDGRKRAVEFSDTEQMAREYLELFHTSLLNTRKKKHGRISR